MLRIVLVPPYIPFAASARFFPEAEEPEEPERRRLVHRECVRASFASLSPRSSAVPEEFASSINARREIREKGARRRPPRFGRRGRTYYRVPRTYVALDGVGKARRLPHRRIRSRSAEIDPVKGSYRDFAHLTRRAYHPGIILSKLYLLAKRDGSRPLGQLPRFFADIFVPPSADASVRPRLPIRVRKFADKSPPRLASERYVLLARPERNS